MLTIDLEDRIESWNPQLEELLDIPRAEALRRKLDEVLPADLAAEIAARATDEHVSGIYKFHLNTRSGRASGDQRFDRAAAGQGWRAPRAG